MSRESLLRAALRAQGLEPRGMDLPALETTCAAHGCYPPGLVIVNRGRVVAGPFPSLLALARSMRQQRTTVTTMQQAPSGQLTHI